MTFVLRGDVYIHTYFLFLSSNKNLGFSNFFSLGQPTIKKIITVIGKFHDDMRSCVGLDDGECSH